VLVATVRRALALYPDRQAWRRMQQAGMSLDHSWNASAAEYVKLYGSLAARQAK
jgi:starch synthase